MPHFEFVEALRFGLGQIDRGDPGMSGPRPQESDHPLDRVPVTFQMRLDGTVGTIADPAGDTKPLRLISSPGAKEDALNDAGDADTVGDGHT